MYYICSEFLTPFVPLLNIIIMKRVLKRSQIIEQLHKLLGVKTVSISLFTELQFNDFYRVYVLVVRHSGIYQVVSIELQYGWIMCEFGNCFSFRKDAIYSYKDQISTEITCSDFNDELNK